MYTKDGAWGGGLRRKAGTKNVQLLFKLLHSTEGTFTYFDWPARTHTRGPRLHAHEQESTIYYCCTAAVWYAYGLMICVWLPPVLLYSHPIRPRKRIIVYFLLVGLLFEVVIHKQQPPNHREAPHEEDEGQPECKDRHALRKSDVLCSVVCRAG